MGGFAKRFSNCGIYRGLIDKKAEQLAQRHAGRNGGAYLFGRKGSRAILGQHRSHILTGHGPTVRRPHIRLQLSGSTRSGIRRRAGAIVRRNGCSWSHKLSTPSSASSRAVASSSGSVMVPFGAKRSVHWDKDICLSWEGSRSGFRIVASTVALSIKRPNNLPNATLAATAALICLAARAAARSSVSTGPTF